MFSKLQFSFRTKIFIVLGIIVFLSIGTFLLVIQETTKNRVRENIRTRFGNTIYAFRQLQELRTQFASDEISSLTLSNPQFRTILSTASVVAEDFGFGLPTDRGEILKDANLRLNSLLPFLAVYHKSDIFLVTSAQGELLFSKSGPDKFGSDLSNLPIFQKIFDEGEAVDIWDSRLQTSSNIKIFPSGGQKAIYQIVAKPVVFGEEIHGVVIWGSRIDRETLESIKEISSVDIALYSGERINASTLPPHKEKELSNLISFNMTDEEDTKGDSVSEVSLGGERFMTMRSSILPDATINENSGFIVLRSLTQELGFLRKLQITLLLIGVLILLVAIGLSFLVSGGVTKPVRTLASAARRIGEGKLETRVDIITGDELEELGGAFNEMVKGLKEREFIKTTFERYVSKAVASELIKNPEMVRLGGIKRELTVMFSDIGGFTTLSETLPPETIVKHLNEYFEGMSSAILEFDGTINQFQGDAIVAFWGAPVPQNNHPLLACLAALRSREFLESLQAKWIAEGLPGGTFRFGINTGEMVVGNIGSSSRFEYTVIGDEVNLASRLEGANKIYGTQILISGKTYEFVKEEITARELDIIRVVGKTEPVRIYELVSRKGELDDSRMIVLEEFQVGVGLYRERKWDEACECFERILELDPSDKPSQEYMRRCKKYQNLPPPLDWGGVFELRSK
ncbi:MAG TPA: adenylate/guanylate cyclase domain-containing protein [Thermodesulfobacteriota bacterium]|nr:adenylate/guanylate cyclase domain-containing protein [Thermodesulfobacteriota bacterium]